MTYDPLGAWAMAAPPWPGPAPAPTPAGKAWFETAQVPAFSGALRLITSWVGSAPASTLKAVSRVKNSDRIGPPALLPS